MSIDPISAHDSTIILSRAAVRLLLSVASSDATSDRLSRVCFERTGGDILAIATDGHRLVKLSAPAPGAIFHSPVILHRGALDDAVRAKADTIAIDTVSLKITAGAATIQAHGSDCFPPWQQVLPDLDKSERATRWGACGEYLAVAADVASLYRGKRGVLSGVEIHAPASGLDPFLIRASRGSERCDYVVMPMRI